MSLLINANYTSISKQKKTANLKFTIDLKDLDFEKEVVLKQLKKTKGHLFFSNDPIREEAIEIIKNRSIGIDENGLSNSEKLRLECWRIWNRLEDEITFEEFYNNVSEKMIKAIRKKYGTY